MYGIVETKAAKSLSKAPVDFKLLPTAAAQEAYDDIWYNMEALLETMQTDRKVQNKDALSYLYLAYQTKLSEDFSKYAAGYNEVIKKREKDGS